MGLSRSVRLLVAVLIALGLVVTGCGKSGTSHSSSSGASQSIPADPSGSAGDAAPVDQSCPTSNAKSFAKTKFVAHAGLAFGAFHRYLWKPYKAGTFKKGAKGRISAFVKGGLAALFIKREIRLASEDAKANPTLCKAIAAPLAKIGDSVKGAFDKAKGGNGSGLDDLNNTIGQVSNTSKQQGDPITENDNPDLKHAN